MIEVVMLVLGGVCLVSGSPLMVIAGVVLIGVALMGMLDS